MLIQRRQCSRIRSAKNFIKFDDHFLQSHVRCEANWNVQLLWRNTCVDGENIEKTAGGDIHVTLHASR